MRKPYSAPKLEKRGDLRDLTQGSASGGFDDSFTISLGRFGDVTIPLPGHDPS